MSEKRQLAKLLNYWSVCQQALRRGSTVIICFFTKGWKVDQKFHSLCWFLTPFLVWRLPVGRACTLPTTPHMKSILQSTKLPSSQPPINDLQHRRHCWKSEICFTLWQSSILLKFMCYTKIRQQIFFLTWQLLVIRLVCKTMHVCFPLDSSSSTKLFSSSTLRLLLLFVTNYAQGRRRLTRRDLFK